MAQRVEDADFLSVDEAAALLGVKKETLYAYVSRGVLRSYKQGIGRKRVYRRDEVNALRDLRPSSPEEPPAPPQPASDDRVLRNVDLPEAETWAGDH